MTTIQYLLPSGPSVNFAKRSLTAGPSLLLSKLVASRLDWLQMGFMTLANEGLVEHQLLKFGEGGKVSSDQADHWLMNWLVEANGIVVAEDWRATPLSPFLVTKEMPAVFHGNEVYYKLRGDPRDFQNWRQIFSNTVPAFHAFVLSDDAGIGVGQTLSSEAIERIASRVESVILGAYDGEGYVVCSAIK